LELLHTALRWGFLFSGLGLQGGLNKGRGLTKNNFFIGLKNDIFEEVAKPLSLLGGSRVTGGKKSFLKSVSILQ
jgi:hypothetical protein